MYRHSIIISDTKGKIRWVGKYQSKIRQKLNRENIKSQVYTSSTHSKLWQDVSSIGLKWPCPNSPAGWRLMTFLLRWICLLSEAFLSRNIKFLVSPYSCIYGFTFNSFLNCAPKDIMPNILNLLKLKWSLCAPTKLCILHDHQMSTMWVMPRSVAC